MTSEARLWVEIALPLPVGQTLTYSLTATQRQRASPGSRARVPVGARRQVGYVVAFRDTPPVEFEARPILGLLDRESPFPEDLLELARFASTYYLVPLGEMFGYATSMRSMSQGRATFTMEFDHYAEAPSNIADAVMKKS